MTPIMFHVAVHMWTGQFLVIKGDLNTPESWEIESGWNTMYEAEREAERRRDEESEQGGEG